MDALITRVGGGTPHRQAVTARLLRISKLVKAPGTRERLSSVGRDGTTTPQPQDVALGLGCADDGHLHACDEATRRRFEQMEAAEAFGASMCWSRPAMLRVAALAPGIAHGQITRDRTRRGMGEVRV